MTRTGSDMRSARLDLAGTREFTLPGAGEARRAAISEATRSWLTDLHLDAVGERPGIALAAVMSALMSSASPGDRLEDVTEDEATADGTECDFGEVFTTDGRIAALNLTLLTDDKQFFAHYNPSVTMKREFFEAHPEIAEVTAGAGGGSSTMPQKSNPVAAKALVTLARLNAGDVAGMQHAMIHAQERDGTALGLEWAILPAMLERTTASLRLAQELADTLAPAPDRIAATFA